ncbi:MAG TPA: AAA family ATPase [Oscillatoriaceae cyanobacterium]
MAQEPQVLAKRYRVLDELGRGGMGVVYRVADQLHGDRPLALKAISATGGRTADLQLRFREEFRAMTRLQHPNLLAVHDFGLLDDGAPYFTMEIVAGQDLEQLVAGDRLPLPRVYELLIQLLQALDFVHARGYVHRDIKSQNIRVTPEGRLVLMDFGLMAQLGLPSAGGSISGTPGYLPPEVVRGGVIDAGSDLYSVGCLAFELLTGKLPFSGTTAEVIRHHLNTKPPSVRAERPELPEALERLVARMLEKDQTRRYRDAADVVGELAGLAGIAVARPSADQKRSYLASAQLIGRESELARLESALARVRGGQGSAVLVGAPAGVGKSRLVRDALLQAALDGFLVLTGRCLEYGMSPYAPVAEALRPLLALTPSEELAARPLLAHVSPELGSLPPCEDPESEKPLIDDEIAGWLGDMAERRPLVFYLDDLHWSDARSLEVFCHAMQALAGKPLFLLGTFRHDELPARSPLWYPIEDGQAEYVVLEPFGPLQVRAMLDAMLGALPDAEALADALFEITGGNAFFLGEVTRFMLDEGLLSRREGKWEVKEDPRRLALPATVADTVSRRLALASPDALALARVAAVIGREQGLDMLRAVSNMDESRMFAALDELVERQFAIRTEGRYALCHDRVRDALYRETPEDVLCDLHQACGEYLERTEEGRHDAVICELAHHFAHGRDLRKAARYLARSGTVAEQTGMDGKAIDDWWRAVRILERLDEPDREARLIELCLAVGSSGFLLAPREAAMALERALELLPSGDSRVPGAVTYLALAHGFAGRPDAGLATVDRGLALAGAERGLTHVALETMRCTNLAALGRVDDCIATAEAAAAALEAGAGGREAGQVARARVGAYAHQNARAYQGRRPNEALQARSIEAAEAIGDRTHFMARHYFGLWYAWTGRQREAQAYLDEARQTCRRINAPPTAWMLYIAPYLLHQRGEFEEARAAIARSWRHEALTHAAVPRGLMRVLEGRVALAVGEPDRTEQLLREAIAEAEAGNLGLTLVRALLGWNELLIARKAWAKAREGLESVITSVASGPLRNPLHQALAERLSAEAALGSGHPAMAEQHAERAIALVSAPDTHNPFELARAQLVLGDARRAWGNPTAAGRAYREAGDGFGALENRHWLHQVVQALEAMAAQSTPAPAEQPLETRWRAARSFGIM